MEVLEEGQGLRGGAGDGEGWSEVVEERRDKEEEKRRRKGQRGWRRGRDTEEQVKRVWRRSCCKYGVQG